MLRYFSSKAQQFDIFGCYYLPFLLIKASAATNPPVLLHANDMEQD